MKYSIMHMYSFNFLKQLSECSRWGSVLPVFSCAGGRLLRGQTRRDAITLVVATRVSKGGDAETLSGDTIPS